MFLGLYKDENNNIISKKEAITIIKDIGKCFIKPTVDSCSGQGCKLLNLKNGNDINGNYTIEKIFEDLGNNFVVQEFIKCHDSISKIYDKSANTFRIITYRWKNEILNTPSVIRIGRNGHYLDNAHAGGIFVAIDDDGTLHDKAFSEFKEEYTIHPDSKIAFKGYKIDLFPTVLEVAKKMHSAIPQVGVVNWDFTIDISGNPILIEANIGGGSIWHTQMSHGKGPFGEKTADILKWMNLMKHTKVEDRKKYAFGNVEYRK